MASADRRAIEFLDLAREPLPPVRRRPGALTVLDITKNFGETTGGIRTYLLEKARHVAADPSLGQVLVVPGERDAVWETDGVRCYQLRGPAVPGQSPYRFLISGRRVARIVAHERPSLIEVGSPFLVPWLARRAARPGGIPLVWFYHSHLPRLVCPDPGARSPARVVAAAAAWAYVRRLSRLFRAIAVASEFVARDLEEAGVGPVERVPLGVDLACFHPDRRAFLEATRRNWNLPNGPLAVFAGRFAREKELGVLLDAWPEVESRTGAHLVLIGSGPSRAYYQRRSRAGRVTWCAFTQNRERLADLLAAADLYVSPSSTEPFGLAALEAMACGTPVLSSNRGGVADRVRASGAGALFPAGSATAFAEAAIGLFRRDLRPFRAQARSYAEQHHAWPQVFERLFALYRRVVIP